MSKLTKGKVTNDMILYFCDDVGEKKIIGRSTDVVWDMFNSFCEEHRLKVICTKTAFGQRMARIMNWTTKPQRVNGELTRFWLIDDESRSNSVYISNDTINEYVQHVGIDKISGCLSVSIWDDFCEYCENNKFENQYSKLGFCMRLSNLYGMKSKCVRFDGKACKILELI